MEINWSNQATKQLDTALDFLIEEGFASYAFELNEQILLRIESLSENYNIYPTDKYKKVNNGNFRAFEIDDYRISYRITKTAIKIIRIRHTSRRTRKY